MSTQAGNVGHRLREWRRQRNLSQLDLALEAEISQRHLSFLENGRAAPSREMLLRLAEHLGVPLRDRNTLLLSAGYAPHYHERSWDDPELASARQAVDRILKGHEPYPALVVDRRWNLVAANAAFPPLLSQVASPALLEPPVNVLRVTLHPQGLAPFVANLPECRSHLLDRLHRQVAATADTYLRELLEELRGYAVSTDRSANAPTPAGEFSGICVPFELMTPRGLLRFFSTITVFGTPADITLSELALEALFPADTATANILRELLSGG